MKYLVGTLCGGLQELPDLSFGEPFEIIKAKNEKDACKIYNEKHKCSYFYGQVMATIIAGKPFFLHECVTKNEVKNILESIKDREIWENFGKGSRYQ